MGWGDRGERGGRLLFHSNARQLWSVRGRVVLLPVKLSHGGTHPAIACLLVVLRLRSAHRCNVRGSVPCPPLPYLPVEQGCKT